MDERRHRKRHPALGWSVPLFICALLSFASLAFPSTTEAGVAANQLCGMAGLGAGCIGTFHPSGIGAVRPNVGGAMRGIGGVRPNVGGMMGGLMGIVGGIILDEVMNQVIQSATEGAAAQATPDFTQAVQGAVETQVRFQQDRDRQLLSAMADVSASQLADASSDMGLLEPLSYQASLGFDRPLDVSGDDALWMRVQDPWYSPESAAPGRPLAVSDNRLQYSPKNSGSLQCMKSMGGELCGFPGTNNPALILKPLPPPSPAPAPPVSIPTPSPAPVPVTSGVPPLLRTEVIPDMIPSVWHPEEPVTPEPRCSAAIAFESPENLLAVARSEDPQLAGGAYILNYEIGKLTGALGKLQGKIATVMTGAYREFVQELLCRNLALLASAPRDIALGQGDVAAQVDDLQVWADQALYKAGMKEWLKEVKGILKSKREILEEHLKGEAKQALKDAVIGGPDIKLDRDIGPYSIGVRHRSPWDEAGRRRHWLEESPHDHLLPGAEDPNAHELPDLLKD